MVIRVKKNSDQGEKNPNKIPVHLKNVGLNTFFSTQKSSGATACSFSDVDTNILHQNVSQSAMRLAGASKKMMLLKQRQSNNETLSNTYYGYKQY